eukprot:37637-Pyramimonas_sp.AAC.1
MYGSKRTWAKSHEKAKARQDKLLKGQVGPVETHVFASRQAEMMTTLFQGHVLRHSQTQRFSSRFFSVNASTFNNASVKPL